MRGFTRSAHSVGGDSHQLELCPKLPVPNKVEVFVEKFDAQGFAPANKTTSAEYANQPVQSENWVTVAPKKRVKSMVSSRQFRTTATSLKKNHLASPITHNQDPPTIPSQEPPPSPSHVIPEPLREMVKEQCAKDEPLQATDEGMDEDEDIEMYLNLHNFEDIEMSTDSSKRKRCEEGEEATSQAK